VVSDRFCGLVDDGAEHLIERFVGSAFEEAESALGEGDLRVREDLEK
jgi:hypothetical protein